MQASDMKLSLPLLAAVAGLLVGGGAGSYWYLAQAGTTGTAVPNDGVFIDMERKFVVPLVEGSRVRSMLVTDLRLEVREGAEERARHLKPKLRDAFLSTLFAMAVAGAFSGDLYSNNVQDELREGLLEAARELLAEDARAVLIGEFLRQDQ
jgi:flagellar protein FliL